MRTALLAVVGALLFGISGCQHNVGCNSCQSCGPVGAPAPAPAHVGTVPHGYADNLAAPGGPPTASYAYPYYTLRAPRDFLMGNPPSIGR